MSVGTLLDLTGRTAEVGDLVFGFAANSLHRDNSLLYIARITDKVRTAGTT